MKEFSNLIKELSQLKKDEYSFYTKNDRSLLELLRSIELISNNKKLDMFSIYRCPCSKVFVHPNKDFEKLKFDFKTDNKKNLLCPACGGYEIDVGLTLIPKGELKLMYEELDSLFDKAKTDNKYSFYMFVSNTFIESDKLFDEIFESVNSYLYIMDDLELKARMGEIGKFKLDDSINYNKAILRLKLLIYCHIVELKKIYNFLNNIIKIAYCEIVATDKEKRKISLMRFDTYSDDMVVGDIINNIQKITNEKSLSLGNFIKSFYNNKLRNAFYHSQYIINDDNDLYLTSYDKLIKKADIDLLFSRCFNFFNRFSENIFKSKQELIDVKEIAENGYKIQPIKKGSKIAFKYIL